MTEILLEMVILLKAVAGADGVGRVVRVDFFYVPKTIIRDFERN